MTGFFMKCNSGLNGLKSFRWDFEEKILFIERFLISEIQRLSLALTLFFPVFSFDPPKNTKGFLMFSGGSKGNIGKKRVMSHSKS